MWGTLWSSWDGVMGASGRSPSVYRFSLASWYTHSRDAASEFYKGAVLPLVWAGVYSSIMEAESDSLLRFFQNTKWAGEEAVMKEKLNIQASLVYVKGHV